MSWGCNGSRREVKPKCYGCSPTVGGHCSTCFSAAKLLPPSKDMPWHCSGSLGPCQLPCTPFWEVFGMRHNTSLCPVCVGCLEQCYGAFFGPGIVGRVLGECGDRAAGWEHPVLGQAEERGRRWACEVLGGVSLRGHAEVEGRETTG